MAVGHYRKKQNKKPQSENDVIVPRAAHAASLSISAKSSDLESDGVKCSEMLDGTDGRPAFTLGSNEKSSGQSPSRPNGVAAENASLPPNAAVTKANRKKMTKKQKSASADHNPDTMTKDSAAAQVPIMSVQSLPHTKNINDLNEKAHSSEDVATAHQNMTGTKPIEGASLLPATKTIHKKHKYSKSERKAHKLMLAASNSVNTTSDSVPGTQSTSVADFASNTKPESSAQSVSRHHDKQQSEDTAVPLANQSTNKHLSGTEAKDSSTTPNDLPSTIKKHKKAKSKNVHSSSALHGVSLTGAPNATPSRNNSVDVRINLNGSPQRLLTVQEIPRIDSSFAEYDVDSKIKIKLPGRKATTVWSEDFSRASSAYGHARSHNTSVSSQRSSSSHKSTQDMRSRQSSHTTVVTHNALENKLQSMILSHTNSKTNTPMTASVSATSEPSNDRLAGSSSPTLIPKALHSAPPDAGSNSENLHGRITESTSIPHDNMSVAIPAVPTLFESRPSQVQAPPFLGPPLVQNVPEHIPNPYSQGNFAQNYAQNPSFHSRQMSSIPYNNNFYTPPMYNPGFMPQMMPAGMPMQSMYETYGPPNGMVYYDQDGMPIYPPHPYEQQFYAPQYSGYY